MHLEAWSPCCSRLQTSVYVPVCVYASLYVCVHVRVHSHCEADVCRVGKLELHCLCSAHTEGLLYIAGIAR